MKPIFTYGIKKFLLLFKRHFTLLTLYIEKGTAVMVHPFLFGNDIRVYTKNIVNN